MKITMQKNLASGIVCLLFSLAALALIPSQVSLGYSKTIFNPRFMPYLVAITIAILGIILIIKNRLKDDNPLTIDLSQELSVAGLALFLIAFPYLIDVIGYLVVSVLTGAMVLYLSGSRNKKHYLIVTASVGLIFLAVEYGLKINLP